MNPRAKGKNLRSLPVVPIRERVWRVVVFYDPVNLAAYVTLIFRKVFGFDFETAHKYTQLIHNNNQATLWSGPHEQAEHYAHLLQQWQLNSKIEKDA